MQQTAGYWWNDNGWIEGICHHDASVHSIVEAHQSPLQPHFIPAPIDLHVHGGGGHDCMAGDDAVRHMLRSHTRYGTGAMLATSVTAPFPDITRFIESVSRVMQTPEPGVATLLGAHLEGPFISPDKLGAQPPYAAALDLEQLEAWFDRDVVRIITYAPELDPGGDVIRLCKRYNVRAQMGHTVCSWAQAQQHLRAGGGVTHLYNAMSAVSHRQGGAATAALAYADYAEIITDGVHVDRAAFDTARRAIPGLYSITDATAATGMPDGNYQLGSLSVTKSGDSVLLPDGTLAGSCLTQQRSIAVLRSWELDWHAIGLLTSAIPARWLGEESLGRIATGALSHWLEIVDDQLVALWLSGERHILETGAI